MKSALASVTDVTKPWIVTPAKQRRGPCSGPPTDWVVLFEFPLNLVGKSTMAFPTGQWRIQGKNPGGPSPPLIFGPNKIFLGHRPPRLLLSKGLDDRASPLSQGLDPALRAIHGAYPNPSIQMEAQSMDFGAVSQTDRLNKSYVSSVAEASPLG